jgi:fibronectin-binding autotransporter adhesin
MRAALRRQKIKNPPDGGWLKRAISSNIRPLNSISIHEALKKASNPFQPHPMSTLQIFRRHRKPLGGALAALMAFWQIGQPLQGASYYWDADTSNTGNDISGTNLGGTGTWNTSLLNWWDPLNPTPLLAWPNLTTDTAIFGGTAGTVTLGAPVTVNNLTFNTTGYTLTGTATNTITLAGAAPGVTLGTGVTGATITALLAGSAGLAFNGGTSTGTLTLGASANANSYTGSTGISSGTLRATSLNALGASGAGNGTLVNSGGALRIGIGGTIATELLSLTGTGVGGGGALVLDDNLASTWSGAITIAAGGATVNVGSGSTFTQGTAQMAVTGNLTKTGAGLFALTALLTTGSGTLAVNAGTFRIASSSTTVGWDSGNITVGSGGTLQTTGSGTNSIVNTGTILVNSGGALDWQQAGTETLAGITINGTGINNLGALTQTTAAVGGAVTGAVTLGSNATIGAVSGGSLQLVTAIAGGGFTLTKEGAGTLRSNVTTGTPFGNGSIVLNAGTLSLNPTAAATAPTGANALVGSTFTYAGGGNLTLTKNAANALTFTIGNAGAAANSVLVRSSRGTLVIQPTAMANLGIGATGENFVVNQNSTAANMNGAATAAGIYNASVVAAAANVGTFVQYQAANGFGQATYTTRNANALFAANEITDVTASLTATTASNPYALRVGPTITLTNAGTTTVNGGAASGTNSGVGGVILNAGATVTTNDAVITGGTLAFGASEGAIFVATAGTGIGKISSAITGTAGLTKFGPGALTLDGNNSGLSGAVQLNQGTLNLNSANAIGTGSFTIKDGTTINNNTAAALTLTANNAQVWDGNFTFTGTQSLNLGTGAVTMNNSRSITSSTAANTLTIGGAITGTGTLTKLGAGQLTLSGSNTGLTGGVTLSAGTLNINNANALGATAGAFNITAASTINNTSGAAITNAGNNPINIANTAALTLTFTGSNALNLGTGAVTLGGGALTLANTGAFALTIGGNIGDNAENTGITYNGPGQVILSGTANTFTGTITATSGALSIASIADGVLFGSGASTLTTGNASGAAMLIYTGGNVTLNNRALSLSGLTSGTFTLDASGTGTLNLANTGTTGVAASGNKNLILRGSNTGSNILAQSYVNNTAGAATLTKLDRGQWVLTNNNTYTGTTSISNGTLTLDFTNTPVKTNVIAPTSALTLGGGTLNIVGHSTATAQTFASTALTANTMSTITAAGGGGTLGVTLGTVTRGASSGLNINLSGSPLPTIIATGFTDTNGIIAAANGAAYVTANGTDWASVATGIPTYVADTFTASTNNINVTTSGTWAGTSLNTLRFNTGTPTLTITGTNTLGAGGILIGSGAGAVNFGGASSTGTVSGTPFTTVSGELNIFNYSSSAATINAGLINNAASNSYLAVSPVGNTLNVFGTGTTILNASRTATTFANAYTGGTNISGTATLQLGQNNAIPFGVSTPGALNISGGATLDLNGKNQIVNGISGSGIVNNTTATPVNFTIGSTNGAGTFSGAIQNTGGGAVSLVKTGTGSITLNGQNTYTGGTTISQGTLLLNFTSSSLNVRNNILPETVLTLGSGTLNVTGQVNTNSVNAQNFSSTTLSGGGAVTLGGTTPAVTVNLGTISRTANAGGTLNVTLVSPGVVNTTSTNNSAGILGGHVTVGAADWGTVNASGNIVAAPLGTTLPAAGTAAGANGNYLVTAGQTQSAASVINSLKITGTTTLNTGTFPITFSGANGGLLTTGTTIINGTGVVSAGTGNEFLIYNAVTLTFNTSIGGGGLTKSGAGTLNLRTVASTYNGRTVINGGVLNVDNANRISSSSGLTLNGGQLTFVAAAGQSQPLALTLGAAGGTIDVSGADGNRNIIPATAVAFTGTGPRNLTISGGTASRQWNIPAIIGDGTGGPTSLTFTGGGDDRIFGLTAANTYTGNTVINRGTLALTGAALYNGNGGLTSVATAGNIIFAATGAQRAILETNSTQGTITRSLGYGPGQIHWEGNGGFGNNSTGTTQIVNLGGAAATMTWGVGGFVPSGNRLQFGGTILRAVGYGTVNFANPIDLNGAATRTIEAVHVDTTNAPAAGILSGAFTSVAGSGLAKEGNGTLILSGNNTGMASNTTVALNGGALFFAAANSIPGTGANITLAANTRIGLLGDTNPITTFASRISNSATAAGSFMLGADSSAALDFTNVPNMRLSGFTYSNGNLFNNPARAATFTGTITPASNTYRFGGAFATPGVSASITTLVLGAQNQMTGAREVDISYGSTTLTASNNYSGDTTINGNGIGQASIGIGSRSAFGTGAINLAGTQSWTFGQVNGDQSVSNTIKLNGGSSGAWEAGSNQSNGGILNNPNQGTLTYLGTVDLGGRSNPTITVRSRATLILGDITNGPGGVNLTQSGAGIASLSSLTSANGGVDKTFAGRTTLGDEATLVIDADGSLGASGGELNLGSSNLQLQPGTTSVTLTGRNFVNTPAKNPGFNTPSGSTLTIPGTFSGSTTGILVKQGLGTLVLSGDATAGISTGSMQIRSGTLRLDAATFGSTVWTDGRALTLGSASGTYSNGGTLEITGTSAQSFAGVTVNPRANNINLTGAMTLTVGTITRTAGSTLNFSVPTGTVASTHAAVAGLVNGATTFNGNDWAAANGTNITALASYAALTGIATAPTITSAGTSNYLISSATSNNVTMAATGTINANTLKYSDPANRTIDIRNGSTQGILRLGANTTSGTVTTVGGILVASGAGALTIGVAGTPGTLNAGGTTANAVGDLVFINNSTSNITVNSVISNNGSGVVPVSYDGRSTGKLILAGANTFTGALIINKGTLEVATVNSVAAAGPLGQGTAAVGNILLNGGTFRANLSANGATDKGFTVNAPSTIEVVANTLTLNTTLNGVAPELYQLGALNAGILKKTGNGTLELRNLTTAANNANLSIEVAAGTLLLNQASTSAISAIDLPGGAGLIVGTTGTVRLGNSSGNQISDTSSVVLNGSGSFDLAGFSETIDGLAGNGTVTTNGNSTLTLGGNNSAGLSPYTPAAAAAGVNATGLNSFSGTLSDGTGTLSLTKVGSGTQIIAAAQAYSGATTINAGTLQLGIANALPSGAGKAVITLAGNNTGTNVGAATTNGSDKVLAPGTLDMGGFDQAINGLSSTTGGFVTNNPTLAYTGSAWTVAAGRQGTKTLTLGNSIAQNPSFSGVIQDGFSVEPGLTATGFVGAINLVKNGTNTQTLTGANTYSGTTAIQSGVLIASGGTNRLPSTTAVTLGNSGNSGVLQLGDSSGAISQTIAGLTTSGSGTTNAVAGGNASGNSTLVLNQTGPSTYSGRLGGATATENNLNFTLQGGGTLTLDGLNNTLTGTTTVQGASTLILDSALTHSAVTVGGASAGTLISNETLGGLLTVGNGGVVAPGNLLASDIGTLTLNSGLTLNNGGTLAMQIGSTATLTTPLVSDLISITGGVFTINAGGLISLTELTPAASVGALLSSVAGSNYTLINYSGASNAGSFGDFGNLGLASSVIGANNYFVTLVHNTTAKTIELNVDNARFWSGATDGQWNTTVANWSPVNPAVYLNTDKVLFQDTYPVIAGNANVVNSTIDLTTSVTPAAVSFNNTAINYTLSGSGDIGGPTGLTKSGTGSLTITNANTFTGNTVISGGSLEMQNAAALGTTAGSITVGNGAALRASGGIAVGAKAINLNGDGISSTGALRNVSGNNSFAGAITLTGNTQINSDAGLLTLSGGITNGSSNLTFGGAGDITESGVIGSGAGSVTVDGTGTVTLSNAANTYTGQTVIKNGTLSVSNIGSVGIAGGLGAPTTAGDGTIAIGDGANTGTLKWTGSANESTDRVIDLAGTTGGAALDASGTGGSVLTLATALTFSGLNNKTLTLTGTGGSTGTPNVITGAIGDPSGFATSLLKTGSGVWRLDAANTYTGTTTINAGTLLFGANQTLTGVTLGGAAGASATLGLGSTSIATLSGNVTFDATNNPLGASITGSGTAALDLGGDGVATISRTFNVGSSSNSGGADLTISAAITDTAGINNGITKAGPGTLVLTGTNTYAGATTVDGGTLSVTPGAIATTGTVNVGTNSGNGSLNLYADNTTATATLATNAGLNVGGATNSGALGFQLSGATGDRINLSGTGTLMVGAAGGLINARALAALTTGSFTLLDTTNTGPTSITGFSLGVLTGGYTYALDNSTAGLLNLSVGAANAGPYYWNGSLGSGGNGSWATLASNGTSTNWRLDLAGTTEAGATPGGVDVIFATDTAANVTTTLDQPYSITGLQFVSNTSGTGNVTIASGSGDGTLTIGANGIIVNATATSTSTTISAPVIFGAAQTWDVGSSRTLTASGVVSGNGNLLTKSSAGTLVLSGVNTYNGGTSITGGTVQIADDTGLGAASGAASINGATLQLTGTGNTVTTSRNFNLGSSGATITVDGTNVYTLNGTLANITTLGTLAANGTGTLALLGTNTYDGGTTISGTGTVQVNTVNGLGGGALIINDGTLRVSGTYSDGRNVTLGNAASAISVDAGQTLTLLNTGSTKVTGAGQLNANGAGTLVLNDGALANDYTGPTVITGGGTVQIATDTALGNTSGAVTLNNGTLQLTANAATARNFSLGSGAGGAITVRDAGETYTVNGAVGNLTSLGRLNANGAGVLQLFGVNTYDGGTTIGASALVNAGTVQINSVDSLGNGGAATIRNATLQATQDIIETRAFNLESAGSKISVDSTRTYTLGGLIANGTQAGTLNKSGAGTLNLTGAAGNTYTGGTFVTAGTLLVNNASGSGTGTGAISVTGATSVLGGSGLATGTATIDSGATLNPGGALTAGTLTLGGLTLSSGSLLEYQLGAIANSDKTAVTGSNLFTANGGTITLTGLTGLTSGTYNLITYNGTLGGSFGNLSLANNYVTGGGNTFYVALVNNTGSVDLSSTNSLTWNGDVAGTIWDGGLTANTNWKSGATTNLSFFNTMVASFDDTASAYTVNLPGTVTPGSIIVNAANDYLFQGAGAITGATGITKSGGGLLTIDMANSLMTGNIALNNGAIEMKDVDALGTGNIAITPGGSLRLNETGINLGSRITSIGGGAAIRNVTGNNSATLPGPITAATSFISDAGTLTLGGNVTGTTSLSLLGDGNISMTGASINVSGNGVNFTVNTDGTVTVANSVTVGAGAIIVNGTGATTLGAALLSGSTGNGLSVSNSGTNNFNGNVTVNGAGGGISLAGASQNTFAAATNTTWSSTGTASISSGGDTTFNGTISGSGALTKSGAGTLTFNAANGSYSGAVNLAAGSAQDLGVIVANANNALGTGAVTSTYATGALVAQIQLSGGITLGNSGFNTTGDGSNGTVSGIIRSTAGANIITGTITMQSGGGNTTLRADSTASLALNGAVTANAAGRYLNLVGAGAFSFGAAGSINDSGANTVGLWSSNSGTTTISSTANTYSLATGITNGSTLNVAALAAVNTNSSIGKGSAGGSVADLVIDGGTLQYNANTTAQTTNRLFSIGTNGATLDSSSATAANTMSFTGAGTLGFRDSTGTVGGSSVPSTGPRTLTLTGTNTGANTLTSIIGDQAAVSGVTSVTKTGVGTWVLNGNNSYTGVTDVIAGRLRVGSATGLGGTLGGTSITAGANLQLDSVAIVGESLTLNGTGIASTGVLTATGTASNSGSVTLASGSSIGVAAALDTLTLSGVISGANTLTKVGLGTLVLSGSGANTYSGLTTISGGTLVLNKTAGVNAIAGDGSSLKTPRDILVDGSTSLLRWDASNQIGDNVSIRVVNGGTVDFNGSSETFYDLRNTGGTVNYGSGVVTITDPEWFATSTNNVTGTTTFGFLDVFGGTNTVFGGGSLTVGSLSGLNFKQTAAFNDGEDDIAASPADLNITLNSSAGTAGLLKLAGNVTFAAATGAGAPGTFSSSASITSGGVAANAGQLDLNGATRTFTIGNSTAAVDMLISARIIGGATDGLTKDGAGVLALTAANSYSGPTTIVNGTLQLGAGGAAGTLNPASGIDIGTGATFAINRTGTVTQGIDFSSAAISGLGGLQQNGSGTTVLNVGNTYSGGTTVSNGTLLVNNTSGSGTGAGFVTVDSGATLGGTGAVDAGGNTILINGTLQVGDTNNISTLGGGLPQTLDLTTTGMGQTTFGAGATIQFDLFSTTTADQIKLDGNFALGGSTLKLFNPNNTTFALGNQWTLFVWNDLLNPGPSTFGTIDDFDLGLGLLGLVGNFDYASGVYSIVPEPSRAMLLLLGLLGLGLRRRREGV